jgi:hypothetical protein
MQKTITKLFFLILITFIIANAQQEGSFPVIFKNLAKESYADSQIYIFSIGMTDGKWCYMTKDGTMLPMNPADENAPGHLTKNGRNYANYAFRLSEASNFRIPPSVGGGRIYISCGEPMYIPVYNNGWGGPNPENTNDPNYNTYYDWFEYTYVYNKVPFGGNTTQVDIFGFCYVATVRQDATNYLDSCGIAMPRDKVIEYYNSRVSEPFKALVKPCRILAPRSASIFQTNGTYGNYLKPYIDSVWDYFTANELKLTTRMNITGRVVNGVLSWSGSESGSMSKPTTAQVWGCTGFPGAFGAAFSAAFNRGVAKNTADWYDKSKYYVSSPYKNEFAMVLHEISIHNKAYGFGYDDVNEESSVLIVGSSKPLTSLTITIYPFKSSTGSITVKNDKDKKINIVKKLNNKIYLENINNIKEISILNINGKIVLPRINFKNSYISIKELPKGFYYIKITDLQDNNFISRIFKL